MVADQIDKLFVDYLADFEAFLRIYRIHQDVTVNIHRVFGRKNGVLVLTSRVHQQQLVIMTANADFLVEC